MISADIIYQQLTSIFIWLTTQEQREQRSLNYTYVWLLIVCHRDNGLYQQCIASSSIRLRGWRNFRIIMRYSLSETISCDREWTYSGCKFNRRSAKYQNIDLCISEKNSRPVVATCDVHFLNPDEHEVYRRIIMAEKGFDDADRQPPLFLRTTDEIAGRVFLPRKKAREIGYDNPVKIAGMIEKISPGQSEQMSSGYRKFRIRN